MLFILTNISKSALFTIIKINPEKKLSSTNKTEDGTKNEMLYL